METKPKLKEERKTYEGKIDIATKMYLFQYMLFDLVYQELLKIFETHYAGGALITLKLEDR